MAFRKCCYPFQPTESVVFVSKSFISPIKRLFIIRNIRSFRSISQVFQLRNVTDQNTIKVQYRAVVNHVSYYLIYEDMVLEQQKLPWYGIFAGFDFFDLSTRSTKTRSPKNWLLTNYFLKKSVLFLFILCVCYLLIYLFFNVISNLLSLLGS